ncbi:2-oxo acid dehydrogenase subunit E2 [Candidatus Peregrinibacteria bacterium]|nr:2-oxo acid dehydrogenase subunit E2 [Candidatus Peregrinibacteria bacterium]
MAFEFKFPDVGEGIQEGEIVRWRVRIGEEVKQDQPLVEVETAKAIVELPSPKSGFILALNGGEGDIVKVGDTLVAIGAKGEKWEAKEKGPGVVGSFSGEEIIALPPRKAEGTPAVRAETTHHFGGPVERVPLHGIRREIAAHMVKSAFTIPHVTHMDECDATALIKARENKKTEAEKQGIKLTYLAFIVKAACEMLKRHPALNAHFETNEIIYKKYYNIGIAIDTPEGLMVPVIKNADQKDVFQIAREIMELAQRCRDKKITLPELQDGTFSITNIGSIGGEFATPIISYGQTANLGVMRIKEKPVAVNGKVEIRPMLSLALSYDHRVVDGAEGARAMNELISVLI